MTTQFGMLDKLTGGAYSAAREAGYRACTDDVLVALETAGIKLDVLAAAGAKEVSTLTVDANGLDENAAGKEEEAERLLLEADADRATAAEKRAQAHFVKGVFARLGLVVKTN